MALEQVYHALDDDGEPDVMPIIVVVVVREVVEARVDVELMLV